MSNTNSSKYPPKETQPRARSISKSSTTIGDIARIAGVSKKSVSRVLNDDRGISDQTRARIKAIMKQVGYQPDRRARALANSRSFLIAIAYDNPNPAYVIELMEGVQKEAVAGGFEIVMHKVLPDAQNKEESVKDFVRRSKCDALLLTPPLSESIDLIADGMIEGTVVGRIAGVDVSLDIPQIYFDDKSAAMAVTQHLIDLGHHHIGFVGGPKSGGPTKRRLDGFVEVLNSYGLTLPSSWCEFGEFSFSAGVSAGNRLLKSGAQLTAIMCCNDELAAGVLHAARELGLKVPDDLSVSGFDDLAIAEQVWPPLTTVKQPVREMGEAAGRILIKRVMGDEASNSLIGFGHQIVIRKSTKPH